MNYPKLKSHIKLQKQFKSHTLIKNSKHNFKIDYISHDTLKYCNGENSVFCIGYKLAQDYQACVDCSKICIIIEDAKTNGWIE